MGKTSNDTHIPDRIRTWARFGHFPAAGLSLPSHEPPPANALVSEKSHVKQHPPAQDESHDPVPTGHSKSEQDRANVDAIVRSPGTRSSSTSQSQAAGATDPPIAKPAKGPLTQRLRAGSVRFAIHTKDAITHSWMNVLLVFIPIGIAVKVTDQAPALIFAVNAVAIIPLAGLLVYATESVAARLGDTLGALLNVSFGNAVELILYVIALSKGEIRIVQASLLGSILSNLLLILGMSFAAGGLRFREQVYNNTVTQMSACLLSLSVSSLLLPTAFHAAFSNDTLADAQTLKLSRATSIVLLIIYIMYLLFQLKSHAYLYESTPQHIIDEESHPGILADMLDSSTSSSSSDSSSDSGTDTSGSHTTTKRIKRAFRQRRRRKSSASSTTNPASLPSFISSPSFERSGTADGVSVRLGPSRRPSALAGLGSGDEADSENLTRRGTGQPLIRDFVETLNEGLTKERPRKQRKSQFKKHHLREKVPEEGPSGRVTERQPLPGKSAAGHVGFADDVEVVDMSGPASKRSYSLRQLQAQGLRPALPKMLTQNVFVTPPAGGAPAPSPTVATRNIGRTGAHVLRRTNSLPDRLNRNPPALTRQAVVQPVGVNAADAVAGELATEVKPESLMSRTASAVLLIVATGLVAVCAEFLVGAIPGMLDSSSVSEEFIGLIILPIVSNAAEHFTAVTVAARNKMDLAIGVSVGSSIQIALFVTPFIVILGWIIGQDMSLYFNLFETLSLFVTVFVVNFLVLDGRSNYLEGALLMAAYTIIAVAAFFYPGADSQSSLGG